MSVYTVDPPETSLITTTKCSHLAICSQRGWLYISFKVPKVYVDDDGRHINIYRCPLAFMSYLLNRIRVDGHSEYTIQICEGQYPLKYLGGSCMFSE